MITLTLYGPDWAVKPQIVSLCGGHLKGKGKGVMGQEKCEGHEEEGREMLARRLLFFAL